MERKHNIVKLTWAVLTSAEEMSGMNLWIKSQIAPLLKGKRLHLTYQLHEVRRSKETKEWQLMQPMGKLSFGEAYYKVQTYLEEMQEMHCAVQVTVWGTIYE